MMTGLRNYLGFIPQSRQVAKVHHPAKPPSPSSVSHQEQQQQQQQERNENNNNNNSNTSITFSEKSGRAANHHTTTTNTTATTATTAKKGEDEEDALIPLQKASTVHSVRNWRFIVLGVLIGCMIGTAISVHKYTSQNEYKEFLNDFHNDAAKILESIAKSIDFTLCSVDALVAGMVSFASYTNQSWPFVTIHHFPIRAGKIQTLSNAASLSLYPLVTAANRHAWEHYTTTHNDWVQQSIDLQANDPLFHGPILRDYTTVDVIYDDTNDSRMEGTKRTDPAYYLPVWQHTPVISSPPYNYDMLCEPTTISRNRQHEGNNLTVRSTNSIYALLKSHQVIISEAHFQSNFEDGVPRYSSATTTSGNTDADPISDIHFPIFDEAMIVTNHQQHHATTKRVIEQHQQQVGFEPDRTTSINTTKSSSISTARIRTTPPDFVSTAQSTRNSNDSTSTTSSSSSSSSATSRKIESTTKADEPSSSTSTNNNNSNSNKLHDTFVGSVSLSVYWKEMMKDILPDEPFGLIVVLKNPCNPTFTYKINGPVATYLGRGDHHSPEFDNLVRSSLLIMTKNPDDGKRPTSVTSTSSILPGDFQQQHHQRGGGRLYTGVPVDTDYCPFTIHVYPSIEMWDHYLTRHPKYMTAGVVFIFAFTSFVFLIYNYWVERRQRQVMTCAIQSMINANELDKIVQDRTVSLQRINSKLEQANQRIQQTSLQQLEHFACMSHEIRTPLNGINGLSSVVRNDMKQILLQQRDRTVDPQRAWDTVQDIVSSSLEAMDMIVLSGELLRTIVDDVLDFAKLGSGKVEVNIQPNVSLQEILDIVIRSIESNRLVASKHLSIHTFYGTSVQPTFTTDSRRLQQILYNLLGNAVKFSRDNSVIELHVFHNHPSTTTASNISNSSSSLDLNRTTYDDNNNIIPRPMKRRCSLDPPLSILNRSDSQKDYDTNNTISSSSSTLRFVVKDYGKGIKREKFSAIFEPFIQAEGAGTEIKHGGTGLGLAITSRLVEALGGTIVVDSVFEQWTEFCVDFPLALQQQPNHKLHIETQSPVVDMEQAPAPPGSPTSTMDVLHGPMTNSLFEIKQELSNVTSLATFHIFLVDDDAKDRKQMESVFGSYNITCKSFDKLIHLQKYDSTSPNGDCNSKSSFHPPKHSIVLIREDLFDQDTFNKCLEYSIRKDTKLVLFGPNKHDSHQESSSSEMSSTSSSHTRFCPLVRILPAALIQDLVSLVVVDNKLMTNTNGHHKSLSQPNFLMEDEVSNDRVSKLKILIAEDNKINQKVLLRILNRLNVMDITLVENGREAVEYEACEYYDVILMDMHMPIMDGMEACKIIRQRTTSSHPIAKIIFLTAHVTDAFQNDCYDAGAIGFLAKPCNLNRIATCLHNLVAANSSNNTTTVISSSTNSTAYTSNNDHD